MTLGKEAGSRHDVSVRIEHSRENVFTVTATEPGALGVGGGCAHGAGGDARGARAASAAALEILERVLGEFDRARERLAPNRTGGG